MDLEYIKLLIVTIHNLTSEWTLEVETKVKNLILMIKVIYKMQRFQDG